jgi:acyl dehydratase
VLAVGQELEPFVVEAIDPARMKTMAAILDDPNPIHFDAGVVRELGLGEQPVNQGPINLGLLMNVVLVHGSVRRFRCRFLGNVLAGERLECRGRVTAVHGGDATVALAASVGERRVLEGAAVIRTSGGDPSSPR